MATHRPVPSADPSSVVGREPVAIADTVKALAAVAAVLGWTFTDAFVAAVISLITAAVFIYESVWTRKRVTSPATLAHKYVRLESGRLADQGDNDTP